MVVDLTHHYVRSHTCSLRRWMDPGPVITNSKTPYRQNIGHRKAFNTQLGALAVGKMLHQTSARRRSTLQDPHNTTMSTLICVKSSIRTKLEAIPSHTKSGIFTSIQTWQKRLQAQAVITLRFKRLEPLNLSSVVVSVAAPTETTAFQDRVLMNLDIQMQLQNGLFRASSRWRGRKKQTKTQRLAPDSTTLSALLMSLVVLLSAWQTRAARALLLMMELNLPPE